MTIRYLLFVLLTLGFAAFISYGTYATSRLLKTWQPERNLLLLPAENAVRWIMIAFCLGLGMLSGLSHTQLGWVWTGAGRQVLLGLALGVAIALFFYVGTRWLVGATGGRFYSNQVIAYIIPRSRRELFGVALAMTGVALLEELLFRSLLLGGFLPVVPGWLLLPALAALFGALHSPQGLWGMAGAALAGLFLGLLFLWSGSLLLPLVTHYVTNMVQIALVMRLGKGDYAAGSSSATGTGGSSVVEAAPTIASDEEEFAQHVKGVAHGRNAAVVAVIPVHGNFNDR